MNGDGARALQTRMTDSSTVFAYSHAAGSRRDDDLPRLGRGSGGLRTKTNLNRPGSQSVALSIPLAGVGCLDVRSLHRLFKAIADRAGLPAGTSRFAYLQRHARQSCQERPATVRDCCANSTVERKGGKGLDDSGSGMPGRCRIAKRLLIAIDWAIASHDLGLRPRRSGFFCEPPCGPGRVLTGGPLRASSCTHSLGSRIGASGSLPQFLQDWMALSHHAGMSTITTEGHGADGSVAQTWPPVLRATSAL